MRLAFLLEQYVLFRAIAHCSEYQLRHSIETFQRFLAREGTVADLTEVVVSRFLQQAAGKLSQRSCANLRTNLLCLWRFAADQGIASPPCRVRKVSRPEPCPIAWTLDEMGAILRRICQLRGVFPNGVSRPVYCEALTLFSYESGLRRSDTWRVTRSQIRPDGSIVLRQHKTQRSHNPRIRKRTIDLLNKLPGDPPLRCPFSSTGDWYVFWREEVIKPAGVRHGALQQLRRTGASWLALDHPEAVQRYLGHRSATMQRHYVDESIARPQQWLPPDLLVEDAAE